MDIDTSDTSYLMVSWRCLGLCVVSNWFLFTDAANDDTRIVFSLFGIPSMNFSVMPVCVRNVHHCSQLPDCLVVVALAIPLVVLRILLVKIPRR